MDLNGRELDLHRLELRFAKTRIAEPQAVQRIAASLERCGQLVPCVVVTDPQPAASGDERLVLIDGYRRVAALRRLGRDTVGIECWTCDVTTALINLLTGAGSRACHYRTGAVAPRAAARAAAITTGTRPPLRA